MIEKREWYCIEVSGGKMTPDIMLVVLHTTEDRATRHLHHVDDNADPSCKILYWKRAQRPYERPANPTEDRRVTR